MNEIFQKMYEKKIPPPPGTFIKAGVGVILINEKEEILFEKRADCGVWGLIGGKVDPGESVTQTLHREVLEETGLQVEIVNFLGVYSEPEDRIVTYLDNGDVAQLVDIVFVVRKIAGNLKKSEESEELKFFSKDNLPSVIVPPAIQPLEDYKKGLVNVIR
ncbi:MAG: NUDIX domain-containing protein [Leptospiraceae bacterium]|nr:NUDIX domain-containing protein [Leptospiraceae bacterium]